MFEIARKYILRTIVINLKVIFSGSDERTPTTDANLERFVKALSGCRKKYSDDSVDDILRALESWKALPTSPADEEGHKVIVNHLEEFLNRSENSQPVLPS